MIVTRFAPSPTGYLHIGGARTALFNWLYARHHGGRMLLRIEDTDRDRSTPAAIEAILDSMRWLGLNWDGDVVFQSTRADRHRQVVDQLVAAGAAYPCYATPAELDEMRELAKAEKRPIRYDGRWRDRDPSEAPSGVKPVIRLRAPTEGETVIEDAVQGRVSWRNEVLDDLVLLRSDGTPTYMLAVVVDDHDMGVTDIIRGSDHLTNAARQAQIYDALGWAAPRMAHIPLIHGADGAKLSKRHGAEGVGEFRTKGYLPAALRNYLVRLGWGHGNQEIFSTEEMIAAFDLDHVGQAASRFDFDKLDNLNSLYVRTSSDEDLVSAVQAHLHDLGDRVGIDATLDAATRARLLAAMPGLKTRARTVVELVDGAQFVHAGVPSFDGKATQSFGDEAREQVRSILPHLESLSEWSTESLESAVRAFADAGGHKLKAIAQPLRVALTGRTTSPPVFDVMTVLGREESLARLRSRLT